MKIWLVGVGVLLLTMLFIAKLRRVWRRMKREFKDPAVRVAANAMRGIREQWNLNLEHMIVVLTRALILEKRDELNAIFDDLVERNDKIIRINALVSKVK